MVLNGGVYGQIDDVQALGVVEFLGPGGIQIIFAPKKIPEGDQGRILADDIIVGGEGWPWPR